MKFLHLHGTFFAARHRPLRTSPHYGGMGLKFSAGAKCDMCLHESR